MKINHYTFCFLIIAILLLQFSSVNNYAVEPIDFEKALINKNDIPGYNLDKIDFDDEKFENILMYHFEKWKYGKTKGYIYISISKYDSKKGVNECIHTAIFSKSWKNDGLSKKVGDKYWLDVRETFTKGKFHFIKPVYLYFVKGNYFVKISAKGPYPVKDKDVLKLIEKVAVSVDSKL